MAHRGVAATLLDVPFDLYRTFVIEERFGFNKMTPELFVVDLVKSPAGSRPRFCRSIALILWLIEELGTAWWIYAWARGDGIRAFHDLHLARR